MYLKKTRPPEPAIHTIGHSNHTLGDFLQILQRNGIQELVDVRSTPFSRHVPHFNRPGLGDPLADAGIAYRFMGDTLGGRPACPEYYDEAGRVQHHLMAGDPAFQEALREIVDRCENWSIALMCTEADPLACHRTLLVARAIRQAGASVYHIMRDGQREDHDETLTRLMSQWGMPRGDQQDLRREQVIDQAVLKQAGKVGYRKVGYRKPASAPRQARMAYA